MTNKVPIYIIANSVISSDSMSGGDKIFIEWSKKWLLWGESVNLLVCNEGYDLCVANGVKDHCYMVSNSSVKRLGVEFSYIIRIIDAFITLRKLKKDCIVYSSSDFLTDVLSGLYLKIRNRRNLWVSALYLIAPNPFKKQAPTSLRSITYHFTQRLSISIMKIFADLIFVLNDNDKEELIKSGLTSEKIKVVSGGVDLEYISNIKPLNDRTYDACYLGRFHEQKGLPDLLDIWERVCKIKETAKLAIIGWGSPEWNNWLINEITEKGLLNNIDLLGFLDGDAKFQILKSSRIFIFPSHRESWGIVACEAMACGLPVVTYALPIFGDIYKKGFIKINFDDNLKFADTILDLLKDKKLYEKVKSDALFEASLHDWNKTAKKSLYYITYVAANHFNS